MIRSSTGSAAASNYVFVLCIKHLHSSNMSIAQGSTSQVFKLKFNRREREKKRALEKVGCQTPCAALRG